MVLFFSRRDRDSEIVSIIGLRNFFFFFFSCFLPCNIVLLKRIVLQNFLESLFNLESVILKLVILCQILYYEFGTFGVTFVFRCFFFIFVNLGIFHLHF